MDEPKFDFTMLAWLIMTMLGWILSLVLYFIVRGTLDPLSGNWIATTIAGLLAGMAFGAIQSILVRTAVSPLIWVLATMVGVMPGIYLFDLGYHFLGYEPPALAYGALFGAGLGSVQSVVLRKRYSQVQWWFLSNLVGYLGAFSVFRLLVEQSVPEGADGTGLIPLFLCGMPVVIAGIVGIATGTGWLMLSKSSKSEVGTVTQ